MDNLLSFKQTFSGFLVLLLFCCVFSEGVMAAKITCDQTSSQEIACQTLEDSVEHWVRKSQQDGRSWFFRHIENLFDVILGDEAKLPFGKSVALLVGVSQYAHIDPDLPFVQNDLEDMRNFLLGKGGFDEVYVAREEIVNRDLIERYIKKELPEKLAQQDRLLFYYAGHGDDQKGLTGYMQFSQAKPGNFFGPHVLAIREAEEWSSILDLSHLLMIFDCCASGLAFAPRGEEPPTVAQVLTTLSKNGSRIVITAGTADEKTFEISQGGRGNGIFTRAFLNAVELGNADLDTGEMDKDGLITIEEIMAQIKTEIAVFEARHNRQISPRRWDLDPNTYRGTFLFLNPEVKNQKIPLNAKYAEEIGAELSTRGGEIVDVFGEIQISSLVTGDVYIDQQPRDRIERGESKAYDLPPGKHTVELRSGEQRLAQEIEVVKGGFHPIKFRPTEIPKPESPIPTPTAFPSSEGPGVGNEWIDPVTGMEFVWIEGGCFHMGSPEDEKGRNSDEGPVHEACVDNFWMGKYEVMQAQWKSVLGDNPSYFKGDTHPVEQVTWNDVQKFLQKLNEQAGKVIYRLPSEAEWEYAARAGTDTMFSFGDDPGKLGDYAWYGSNSNSKIHPVGQLKPNAWGLYDMHGNVWEWCQDWYDSEYYSKSPKKNPQGPSSGGIPGAARRFVGQPS